MKKVLFLHIPKTAGQSTHQFLIDRFGKERVCPARVNDQFRQMSIPDLQKYTVFSGHVDWSLFDEIKGPLFTFTILRDPFDRILSFYFYLREQAKIFEKRGELDSKPGLKAALQNTPQEFFVCDKNAHRNFIDQNIDNFYTYYFAGRKYTARDQFGKLVGFDGLFQSTDSVVDLAEMNLKKSVNGVYGINEWERKLTMDLGFGGNDGDDPEYNLNRGRTNGAERKELLVELGADDMVFDRISELCQYDYNLINRLGLSV